MILPDSDWQARVMAWASEASAVVMYSGKSQWVTWEEAPEALKQTGLNVDINGSRV